MTTATIVNAWKDATTAYATARVEADRPRPGGGMAAVEYTASTPLLDSAGQPKSNTVLLADLAAALKAARDADRILLSPPAPAPLGITGTVTL